MKRMRSQKKQNKAHRQWKKNLVVVLAALVVFSTTYALILPAITIDEEAAGTEPGFFLEEETGETPAETAAAITDEAAGAAENAPEKGNEAVPAGQVPESIVSMPPRTFEALTENLQIWVDTPEGALPENVVLKAEEVDEAPYRDAAAEVVEGTVRSVQAVDISFCTAEGEEIEPLKPVSVRITSRLIAEAETIQVVHMADDAQAQLVETAEKEENGESVRFDADSFSVYVIVGLETIVTDYLTADGETYTITVTYGPEAGIPEGAVLKVTEITEGMAGYDIYAEEAAYAIYQEETVSLPYLRLFDISIRSGSEEVQPAVPVQAEIALKDDAVHEAANGVQFHAVHFAKTAQKPWKPVRMRRFPLRRLAFPYMPSPIPIP